MLDLNSDDFDYEAYREKGNTDFFYGLSYRTARYDQFGDVRIEFSARDIEGILL